MSGDLAADLAARLRDAHRQLAAAGLSPDEKLTLARRLVALSDSAKIDLERASRRLDRLLADLDGRRSTPDGNPAGPSTG